MTILASFARTHRRWKILSLIPWIVGFPVPGRAGLVPSQNTKARLRDESSHADMQSFAEPIEEHRRAGRSSPPAVLTTRDEQRRYYQSRGMYRRAIEVYEPLVVGRVKKLGKEHPLVAKSEQILAGLCVEQGRYADAIEWSQRALSVHEQALDQDELEIANDLFIQGRAHKRLGEFEEAEPRLRRALEIRRRTLGNGHPEVAAALEHLGHLYREQGDLSRAEAMILEALQISEAALGSEHPQVADHLLRLGLIDFARGDHLEAEERFRRCLAIFERSLGPQHPRVGSTLNALSWLYISQGEVERSDEYGMRSLSIFETALGADHPLVADTLYVLAAVRWREGKREQAIDTLERLSAIYERTQGPLHEGVLYANKTLGLYHLDQGRFEQALAHFEDVLRIGDENLSQTLVVADEQRRLAYVSRYVHFTHVMVSSHIRAAPHSSRLRDLALTMLLRRKGRALDLFGQSVESLRRSLSADDMELLDDLTKLRARYAAKLRGRSGDRISPQLTHELSEIREQQWGIWDELAAHNSKARDLSGQISVADIQSALPRRSALLEFALYYSHHDDEGRLVAGSTEPRYAVYLVTADGIECADLGPAQEIDEHVEALRAAIVRRSGLALDEARTLYDRIMQPTFDLLGRRTRRLFIAPDSILGRLPFAALHDGDRYLVETHSLRHVSTGRELLRPWADDPTAEDTVVVVADPMGSRLSGTRDEAREIQELFPGTSLLVGSNATKSRVIDYTRPWMLHLGAHGFFRRPEPSKSPDGRSGTGPSNPMLHTGVILADEDPQVPDREFMEGHLTAYEISGWDLRGTQVVTLSACDSGLGELRLGEGVMGLRRAFALAGAQTLVMSLWKVDDAGTSALMKGFYRRLAKGESRASAMQRTQLELLCSEQYSHPYFWAGFVTSGEWGPLEHPTEGTPNPIKCHGCRSSVGEAAGRGHPSEMLLLLLALVVRRRRAWSVDSKGRAHAPE